MKKYLSVLMLLMPLFLAAQNQQTKYVVKGQAVDSISQETLPYVTCSVVSEKNPQQVISRFASDLEGKFSGEIKAPGKYTLIVSCVGQEPTKRTFSVSEGNTQVQLGKIALAPTKQSLKEVSVVATRPLIKAEADKITYDAEQDPESKSSTVLDMLRKVPMITVDGQDNIQLKGSSNFKFFLNGKPTNMFNNNPGMILKSMPSSMVKNVEVITQPGAKYDAEGVGGIINIVTIQQTSAKGYSATLSGQASTRGSYGGGLNLMIQSGKFSFSGNYNYMYNSQFPVTTTTERNSYVTGAPYPVGRQVATVDNKTPMQFGTGQLSYEMDSLNLFTFSFNRRFGRPLSNTEASTLNLSNTLDTLFAYSQSSTQRQSWGSTDFGLDYQRSFKKKGKNLTLSYKLSNTPNSSNYSATNTINSLYSTVPQYGLAQWSESNNIASTNEHTFQTDYSNPIGKGQTLEMGAKFILRLNSSETDEKHNYFDYSQPFPYSPFIVNDSTSWFSNNQDILGAYGSYTGNFGKWSLKGGLRYEHTWLNAEFNESERDFNNNYGAIVPSGIITYRLTDMKNLKLGYNKRIQRPSIGYLNPYVDRRDPNYISYGNPDLQPENNHNITFGYSSFAQKYNLSAELSYSFVNNAIEQYSFIPNGSAVQEITYGNIGKKNQLGLNLFGSYRGLPWLNLYTNGSINYVDMKSDTYNLANNGFTGRMFLGGTFMLPKDFRISTGGGGSLPQITLQGSQSAFYFSYMALSKDFLKKRLNVSLSGVYLPKSHIIITTKGINSSTGATTFDQRTDVHLTKSTELRMNVSYRIGTMNAQVKKTKATISNDDQKMKDNSSLGESPM
jgi:outer membrane receptor protein involved in Fe transport